MQAAVFRSERQLSETTHQVDFPIDQICADGGTQMRAQLAKEVYCDYSDKMLEGVVFPPVDVFYDGTTYWLADGFHRYRGAREANLDSIPAIIHWGSRRDAILHATGANKTNGLHRSNADKRNAVITLLNDEERVTWSDGKIAERAGVSQNFVSELRRQLKSDLSSPVAKQADKPRTGKDGKTRQVPNPQLDASENHHKNMSISEGRKRPPAKPASDMACEAQKLLGQLLRACHGIHEAAPNEARISRCKRNLDGVGMDLQLWRQEK